MTNETMKTNKMIYKNNTVKIEIDKGEADLMSYGFCYDNQIQDIQEVIDLLILSFGENNPKILKNVISIACKLLEQYVKETEEEKEYRVKQIEELRNSIK